MIDRTAIVIDNGLFQGLAHRLSKEYRQVLYWRPWVGSFSHPNDFYVGSGYENIEKIPHYEHYFDDPSITWVFPDLHYPELQQWLRSIGRHVWGAGHGEELELLRGETKELLEELKLPVKPWWRVVGITALRECLQEHEDVFVKVSKMRGLMETFCSPNYDLVEMKLNSIQHDLGGRCEVQEFIVEEGVPDAVEVGYDGWCIDGQFPSQSLVGVEKKDCCYFGKVKRYDAISSKVREVNNRLADAMKAYRYRGFFSTEIRIGKDGKPYLIDVTARHASPAGESILATVENLGEVIEGGAQGQLVEPKMPKRFVAQAIVTSSEAKKEWVPFDIPKRLKDCVHLYHSMEEERSGNEYVIPVGLDMEQVGSVTACADSPEKAIALCKEYCEEIQAFGLKANTDALEEAAKETEKV